MDNLDTFSNTFFGRDEPVATDEPTSEDEDKEEVTETEDDTLATEEDTDASEETTEDDEPTEEEEEEPQPQKKGKKSFQDRIDELTRGKREAERREADLLRRLEALEARKTEVKPELDEPKPLREQLPAEAPNPDARDENGEPIYKLGEFDQNYIRDLTKFMLEQETKAFQERQSKEAEQRMVEAAQEELKSSWLQKVEETEEELPDLREKLADMGSTFNGIDPNYGEFLAATIMTCEHGPRIMYYLSQNIGEAQKIVASGPAAATLAIGRLDAKFNKPVQEEKRNTKKVSNAPTPPEATNRGKSGRFAAPADTDNLDAFEREFYRKK
jgi:hypothetical protein